MSKLTTDQAAALVGMCDVRLFTRRARFAGWDPARFAKEAEVPAGLKERFVADMQRGVSADLQRRIDRFVRDALAAGPRALAAFDVPKLGSLVSDRLKNEVETYNPFTMGGLLICGPTGAGKSVAGVAALRRSHGLRPADMNALYDENNEGRSCLWVRALDLPNARLETGLGQGEAPLVRDAIAAEFIVLDDLGWESKRAGADDVVSEVIAARYDAGRITYATTGLRPAEFVARYGTSVARRIVEARGLPGKVVDLWSAA